MALFPGHTQEKQRRSGVVPGHLLWSHIHALRMLAYVSLTQDAHWGLMGQPAWLSVPDHRAGLCLSVPDHRAGGSVCPVPTTVQGGAGAPRPCCSPHS